SSAAEITMTDLDFGRTVVPVPLKNKPPKKDKSGHEYYEYSFIGDAINVYTTNGQRVAAIDRNFRLRNGLVVTYGQINAIAGDFYGTEKPISDGADAQDQSARFLAAYNILAEPSTRQPKEAQDILAVLQTEVKPVNEALSKGEDLSIAYGKLPNVTAKLEDMTAHRPFGFPSYLGLARINWDHFGLDARTAYAAGHAMALQTAAEGDLERAYTVNAFADHFLEDMFSAGRLRTPRRGLHRQRDIFADACSKFMHDEDGAIGLTVENLKGESWICFGDKRALDEVASYNLGRCVAAVQVSADEIYEAYVSKRVPDQDHWKAWTIVPTLQSANHPSQQLSALFRLRNTDQKSIERRSVIEDRRADGYTIKWWFWSTATECKTNGWWRWPIAMDGPLDVLPWTNFAVTAPETEHITRLYYQKPLGGIRESVHRNGNWTSDNDLPFDAAPFTPLAAVTRLSRVIRLFYLSPEYKLQEACHSKSRGWYGGGLNALNVQAAKSTSIAAFTFDEPPGVYMNIRVYCQESNSNAIKEFRYSNERWSRSTVTFPTALSGTGLAAIVYRFEGLQHRIYYQSEDLRILEYCHGANGWFQGYCEFDGGKASSHTPICALYLRAAGVVLDVYWMNTSQEIIHTRQMNGRWNTNKIVGPLASGSRFAAGLWDGGTYIHVYYQSQDYSVQEVCQDGVEAPWNGGDTVVPVW
ncbi:fungal fucose-specific lectin-domain-containing protein, partial [Daedaleopsis nitida]